MTQDTGLRDKSQAARERRARTALSIACEARQGVQPWQRVHLDDLSSQGFRMSWTARVIPRQTLRIRIPGLAPLSAQIRWQEDAVLGCEFLSPLHEAVFNHIVRNAR